MNWIQWLLKRNSSRSTEQLDTAPTIATAIASAEQFADQAAQGAAKLRVRIDEIPAVLAVLMRNLQSDGVPADALDDLCNNSLMSVCPNCGEWCGGRALLRMEMLGGANVMFTGRSGGLERMLDGRCINYSCNSTEHELFWCPDLDHKTLEELRSRGIQIDPNIQHAREHVWVPKSILLPREEATPVATTPDRPLGLPEYLIGRARIIIVAYEGPLNQDLERVVERRLMPLARNMCYFKTYCNAHVSALQQDEPLCGMIKFDGDFPRPGVSMDSLMAFVASKDSLPSELSGANGEYIPDGIGYWIGTECGKRIHATLLL